MKNSEFCANVRIVDPSNLSNTYIKLYQYWSDQKLGGKKERFELPIKNTLKMLEGYFFQFYCSSNTYLAIILLSSKSAVA